MTAPNARIEPIETADSWQRQLRTAVRDLGELAALLELPLAALTAVSTPAAQFPLLVPRAFVARMKKRDLQDPLLRQVLPAAAERIDSVGFNSDPLDERRLASNGQIQKYPGRALMITTGACPVHCRYCFRRSFPYAEHNAARDDWQPALAQISATPGLSEIILSGGDPFSLSNTRLQRLLRQIEANPEIKTLRIHTRFPIVLPDRVDSGLIDLLTDTRLNTVVVLHANHAAELDRSVAEAAARLKSCTNFLLNQSVLLKGINDRVESLIALSERLLECGIVPYYLHLLDRVSGAAHFEVTATAATALIKSMRQSAPGYCVPRLVFDQTGELSKTPVV